MAQCRQAVYRPTTANSAKQGTIAASAIHVGNARIVVWSFA